MLNLLGTGDLLIQVPRTDIDSVAHKTTPGLMKVEFDSMGFRLDIKVLDPFPLKWLHSCFWNHLTADVHAFDKSGIEMFSKCYRRNKRRAENFPVSERCIQKEWKPATCSPVQIIDRMTGIFPILSKGITVVFSVCQTFKMFLIYGSVFFAGTQPAHPDKWFQSHPYTVCSTYSSASPYTVALFLPTAYLSSRSGTTFGLFLP